MSAHRTHRTPQPAPAPPTNRAQPVAFSSTSRLALDPAVWQREMRSLRIIARSLGVVLLTLIAHAVITGLTPTIAVTATGTVVLLLACVRLLYRGRQLESQRHPQARPPEAATYRSTRQHPATPSAAQPRERTTDPGGHAGLAGTLPPPPPRRRPSCQQRENPAPSSKRTS